jgi:hypothetical protein
MILKKQKPIFVIFSLLLLFFLFFSNVSALENKYPGAMGEKPTETTEFPDYIRYIFNFSIILAGIIAFGVIVWAGIKILTSPDRPETIKDARAKIVGAFLGIVVLLSSYLILITIHPDLIIIGISPVKPTSGVYLVDEKGKNHYFSDSSKDIGFNAKEVKFISPKEELIAVYDESENEKINEGPGSSKPFTGKVIYFLRNKPGIYLYPKTDFLGLPRYFNTSISDLSIYSFDKKGKSVKFVDSSGFLYRAIFFTESDLRGRCGIASADISIANIETGAGSAGYTHPIGAEGLSSFMLFNFSKINSGNVIFYNKPNCSEDYLKYPVDIKEGVFWRNKSLSKAQYSNGTPLQNNIVSFKINGNFAVLLNTQEEYNGLCQIFKKPSGDNCYPSIVSSYMWDPSSELGPSVGSIAIIPITE